MKIVTCVFCGIRGNEMSTCRDVLGECMHEKSFEFRQWRRERLVDEWLCCFHGTPLLFSSMFRVVDGNNRCYILCHPTLMRGKVDDVKVRVIILKEDTPTSVLLGISAGRWWGTLRCL